VNTRRSTRFAARIGLLVASGVFISGCGETEPIAVNPPLLEGTEAFQAVQSAREPQVKIHGTSREYLGPPPLIIMDGEVVDLDYQDLADLSPDDIANVRVFKGEQARERFGPKGENGVIEITLKEHRGESGGPSETEG
jgi:hypothetical protein